MKTIILISSIFYILGLKISHKIDIVNKSVIADKTSSVEKLINPEQVKSITLKEGLELNNQEDSLQKIGNLTDHPLISK